MSQTDLTKIKLYEKTVSSMTTNSVQPDDEYSIKDMPIGGITNAQMLQALDVTKKGLFKVGAVYQCTDEGTYEKGKFYKFTGYSWEESELPVQEITVDSAISSTSTNPVQNKVVKQYVDNATSKEEIIKKLPPFKSTIHLINVTANTSYGFPIVSSTNFAVDWGDGTFEFFNTATTTLMHTFTKSGTIYVQFYGDWKGIAYSTTSNTSKNLIWSVYYDSNIIQLPTYAFYNCGSLEYFDSANKIGLNSYAFYWCRLRVIDSVLKSAPQSIPTYCFYRNGMGGEILLNYAESIGTYAFSTNNITKFRMANGSSCYLSAYAFSTCHHLNKVEIAECINTGTIEANCFYSCETLNCLRIENRRYMVNLQGSLNSHTSYPLPSNFVILVPSNMLNSYKTATNWSSYANQIYPIGGQYSETVYIYTNNWTLNSQTNLYEATMTVVGATNESRNVIEYSLVDSSGNQIEDTYGLGAKSQASRSITFTAQTVPTGTIRIFVKSTLTNYQE